MHLTNPAQDRARNETMTRQSDLEVERLVLKFRRAFDRQSHTDAEIARSLIRILKGDERGVARGVGHELRKLIGEIAHD